MVGNGGSSAGSYLADLASPIPSHCASIVATSTLRVIYLPSSTAPNVSNNDAKMHTCLSVSTFAPYDVPKELATSFPPMPNAKIKAIMKPVMTIHSWSGGIETMVIEVAWRYSEKGWCLQSSLEQTISPVQVWDISPSFSAAVCLAVPFILWMLNTGYPGTRNGSRHVHK